MTNQVQNMELHPTQRLLRNKGEYENRKIYFICKHPNEHNENCGYVGTFSDMISHTAIHWHCHMFVCQVCSRQIHEYNGIYHHMVPDNHHLCKASPREMTHNTSNRLNFVDLWKARNIFISQISKGEYARLKTTKKVGARHGATPMYDDEEDRGAVVAVVEDRFGYDDNNYNQQNKNSGSGGGRNANHEPRRQSVVRFTIPETTPRSVSPPPRFIAAAPPGINPRGGTNQNQRSLSRGRGEDDDFSNPPRDYQSTPQNRGRAGFGDRNSSGGGNNNNWNNRNDNYRNRNKSRGRDDGSGDFRGGAGGGGGAGHRSPSLDHRTPNYSTSYGNRKNNYNTPSDPRMNQSSDSIYRNQNMNNRNPTPASSSTSMFRSPTQSPEKNTRSGARTPSPPNRPGPSSYSNPPYSRSPPDYPRPSLDVSRPPPLPNSALRGQNGSGTRNNSVPQPVVHRSPSPLKNIGSRNTASLKSQQSTSATRDFDVSPSPTPSPQSDSGFQIFCGPSPPKDLVTGASRNTRGKANSVLKRKAATRFEQQEELSGTIDLTIQKPTEMMRNRRSSVNYRSKSRGRSMSKKRESSDDRQQKELEKTRKEYQVQGKSTVKVLQNTSRMSSLLSSNPVSSFKSRMSSVQLPPKKTDKLDRLKAKMAGSLVQPEPPHTPTFSTTTSNDSISNIPLPSMDTPGSSNSSYKNPFERIATYSSSSASLSPQPVPPPMFPPGIAKRPRLRVEEQDDDVEVID